MPSLSWWAWTLIATEWLIRLSLIVVVILRRRPVSVSLAWITILVATPVFGALLYLLIGENRLGTRRIRLFHKLTEGMDQQAVGLWRHRHQNWTPEEHFYQQIWRTATAVAGLPPLGGNSLKLIGVSEQFLAELSADIDKATSHVHLLYYIYTTTPASLAVSEAVIRAVGRGVQCRILVDAVGSREFLDSDVAGRMRAAGVKVVAALPVNPVRALFERLDLRNHRKVAVIDGRIAYTGSQNISDSTFRAGFNPRVGSWIDATVRAEGPAAQALGVIFLQDWQLDSGETVADVTAFLPDLGPPKGECVVQVFPSGPGPTPAGIHETILTTIYAAKEELIITTPYFVPDDATRRALQAAAVRGVRVILVMPLDVDGRIVAAASRAHWLELLESGVRIMLYRGGLLHAKTISVDRLMAFIGSANLDMRSFYLNFEATLIVYDDDFASVLRFLQMDYISDSEEVHLDQWRSRSRLRTFADSAAQLLGPLL
jgi:cardiolipin synthase A/B